MKTIIVGALLASFAILIVVVPLTTFGEAHPFRPVTPIQPVKENTLYTVHPFHPFRQ